MNEPTKDSREKCETCKRPLVSGHVNGNHVRGNRDEQCDACYTPEDK